jgi:hypothetical protein
MLPSEYVQIQVCDRTGAKNTTRSELAVGTSLHTPTPFARNGLLYVSSGYFSDPRRPVFAIRPGASGNIL